MSPPSLLDTMQAYITTHALLEPGARVLVAVSGGLDSVVLTHLLHTAGYDCGVAHCNFHLRHEDSDMDEMLVIDLAAKLALPHHLTDIDTVARRADTESTQMTARRCRYLYFEKILDEYNYDALAVAHHLDDNIETLLLNLLRGTGITGLRGMLPGRHRTVRPLLELPKQQLLEYAIAHNLEWREDASNATDHYLRNRIRHRLLPELRELGMTDGNMARTFTRLRAEAALSQEAMDSYLTKCTSTGNGRLTVDLDALPEAVALRELIVGKIVAPYGFTGDRVRQLCTLTQRTTLESATAWAEVSTGKLVLGFHTGDAPPLPVIIEALPYGMTVHDKTYTFELIERPVSLDVPNQQFLAFTGLPLHLRARREGERVVPLGMTGHRSLKKVLNDLKLNAVERRNTLLLCSSDGEVLSIVGRRVMEAGKVRAQDVRVLRVKQTESPEARGGTSGL